MPNAQKVEVLLDTLSGIQALAMAKGASSLWSLTSAPLPPDIYSYRFGVDGVEIIDPNAHEFVPNHFEQGGLFHVPGSPAEPWEDTNVPHGVVHRHMYSSAVTGDQRDYHVYTPPGFDPKAKTKYPVLYLLHGFSDYSDAWIAMGHANFILDNLIAQGKSKPMIVVMPSGYGTPKILNLGWEQQPLESIQSNLDNFAAVLMQEIIPRIEKQYPVSRDGEQRAIAGLSMGGAESLYVGLNHIDQFAWIGAMSAAIRYHLDEAFPKLSAKEAKRLRLLWISCGKEDDLLHRNREFENWLTSKRITFTAAETEGAHEWPVWRRNLTYVAQLLFR